MSNTVEVAVDREVLIYGDGRGRGHVITDANWAADRLTYVERKVLAARLRAIADVIDGGDAPAPVQGEGRGAHIAECSCLPPYADCAHPPCDCEWCAWRAAARLRDLQDRIEKTSTAYLLSWQRHAGASTLDTDVAQMLMNLLVEDDAA